MMTLNQLKALYRVRKKEIVKAWARSKEPKSDEEMFCLLVSCILSSRAKWSSVVKAVSRLKGSGALRDGNADQIRDNIKGISGKYVNLARLAQYVVEAREQFPFLASVIRGIHSNQIHVTPHGLRFRDLMRVGKAEEAWKSLQTEGLSTEGLREMVKAIKGIGDKQASHFLASLGFEDYAVLDVHVLEGLVELGVIPKKPKSLTHGEYLTIEGKMKKFCQTEGIPFHHLDTILWEVGSGVQGSVCPQR
jgi:thermostable 8-oxoguanine DNA glycosylase